MSDRDSDEDLSRLVAELVTALRDLEDEVDPPRGPPGPRPPSPRELRRFTSEVAIPGIILVLETNIRALRLLQRALEFSERAEGAREDARLGERARSVSDTTLDKLDDALADLEGAIEGRPDNEEAARLLDDARSLREEVQTRLAEYADEASRRSRRESTDGSTDGESGGGDGSGPDDEEPTEGEDTDEPAGPQVDVDAELESIKAELDDHENGAPGEPAGTSDEATDDEPSGDADGSSDGDADEDSDNSDDSSADGVSANDPSDPDPT